MGQWKYPTQACFLDSSILITYGERIWLTKVFVIRENTLQTFLQYLSILV